MRVGLLTIALSALFIPTLKPVHHVGDNIYTLFINNVEIGKCNDVAEADRVLIEARKNVVGNSEEVVLIDAADEIVGSEVLVGKTDDFDEMVEKATEQFSSSLKETMKHSYTIKIDDYMVTVASADEVRQILNASIETYVEPGLFSANLVSDSEREVPVFVPTIEKAVNEDEENTVHTASDFLDSDGFFEDFDGIFDDVDTAVTPGFDDYEYGVQNVYFADNVEVVEAYVPTSQITPIDEAIADVTKEKEEKTIYEVVSGDTLSGIATKTGISVEDLISLNDSLTNANSVIRVGDELTVTVPQPELSVYRDELVYYEGTYEADVIYQYNDEWYTTKEVTLQDPSSGYHKAVEKIVYLNNDVASSEVVMEEVVVEAIPKIVEKGTKIPPTYIRPISGGHITDSFGYRTATIRGMTSFHQGVDLATPIGTSVSASCGGYVSTAGWVGTYGYAVFIDHPDGRQTRYAHLSRILVSKGDYVSQGQKIALSGNTGASTGPHLHFEMRIGGTPVNPFSYLN